MKHLRQRMQVLATGVLAAAPGCSQRFDIEAIAAPRSGHAQTLIVFVTGFTDKPEEMREHDVLETIYEAAGPVDALVVFHESIEYLTGSFVPQMEERITTQTWFQDYETRILVGFSSGGTAALEFASKRPGTFDAVVLYAPFLGPRFIVDEIAEAGGLAAWTAPPPREDPEELWLWLKRYGQGPMENPLLYFLWSRDDEVAPGLALLQEYLPPDRVRVIRGPHGWASFDPMWRAFVHDHRRLFVPASSEAGLPLAELRREKDTGAATALRTR